MHARSLLAAAETCDMTNIRSFRVNFIVLRVVTSATMLCKRVVKIAQHWLYII